MGWAGYLPKPACILPVPSTISPESSGLQGQPSTALAGPRSCILLQSSAEPTQTLCNQTAHWELAWALQGRDRLTSSRCFLRRSIA